MLNKKFLGKVAFVVAFVSLTMLVGNFAYAQKKGTELADVPATTLPVCPTCKNVSASHTKGKTTAPMVMVCPDCKTEITEFGVSHCDKCEKDFLSCLKCQGLSKAAAKCPKCEKVLSRRIKGKIQAPVKWEMECPDCKKKPQEWLLQHCDECEADFLACPLCKEQQEKHTK